MLASSLTSVAQDGSVMALKCARACLPALRTLHLPRRQQGAPQTLGSSAARQKSPMLASRLTAAPHAYWQRMSRRPFLVAAAAGGRAPEGSPAVPEPAAAETTTPGEILTQAAQTGVATSTLVLGELFSMLGAQTEARPRAAAGTGTAGEATGTASEYALLGDGGDGHGDGGKAGSGGDGGRGGEGGHKGSHEESGFPRGAALLLVALAALACANQLNLRKTQTSSQRQPAETQRQLAARTQVLFGTATGGSSSRMRRSGVQGSSGRGLLDAWSTWLPRYADPAAEAGSGTTGSDEDAALATSRFVQAHPWSASEPHHGMWRDERAGSGGGLGCGGGWARQGLSQSGSGASSRQRSSGSGVDSTDAVGGVRLPTSAAAATCGPGSAARSWGPRETRVDFADEISRLGSARDGLHAAHGRANQWLQEDAARSRGSSRSPTGAPGPGAFMT